MTASDGPGNAPPPGQALAAGLAPLLVWALQFVALQALLGLGCGRLPTHGLRWLALASGVLGGLLLVLLAWRSRRAPAATGVALAGLLWSTLAALWLAPCAALR